jgi:hypothetical protein
MTVLEATERGIATWKTREPWMHISSPKDGWGSPNVEAKQKERAVIAIQNVMRKRWSA